MEKWNFIGIDYGSKMAGTTVVAWVEDGAIQLAQSEKKKDADRFLLTKISALQPKAIFLDAPLSLPGVYRGLAGCEDYFYRKADRELNAMSPMFLGGLTARAMKLKAAIRAEIDCEIYETYPSALAIEQEWKSLRYKKEIDQLVLLNKLLSHELELPFDKLPSNWHQFDAAIALLSGKRFFGGNSIIIGDKVEGLIIF